MTMYLYKISQSTNSGYDTYDSAIVAAPDKQTAKGINPDGDWRKAFTTWANNPEQVSAERIGTAKSGVKQGVILASFNAG